MSGHKTRQDRVDVDPNTGTVTSRVPIVSSDQRKVGYVKKLKRDKGFGFLQEEGQPEPEYFFHYSLLKGGLDAFGELTEGDKVAFHAVASTKGARAVMVERL